VGHLEEARLRAVRAVKRRARAEELALEEASGGPRTRRRRRPARRGLRAWRSFATISLPDPVSPVTRTVESLGPRGRGAGRGGRTRTVPDERAPDVRRSEAALEKGGAPAERLRFERPLDAHVELVERTRLGDVVERPSAPPGSRCRWSRGRQHDHVGAGLRRVDGLQHLEPVPVGQPEVEEHDLRLALRHATQGLVARPRGRDVVARRESSRASTLRKASSSSTRRSTAAGFTGPPPARPRSPAAGRRISNVDPGPARSRSRSRRPSGGRSSGTGRGPGRCPPSAG